MRILHVSTNEREGGAGRAANRLHHGLLNLGVQSEMLVQSRSTKSSLVRSASGKLAKGLDLLRPTLDELPVRLLHPEGIGQFSSAWFPDRLSQAIRKLEPDLLHLHSVAKGHIQIETLTKIQIPIIWTFHDMWPMTGGCFHSFECDGFKSRCGKCPRLSSKWDRDLSRWVYQRKARSWKHNSITVVCPSEWIATRTAESALFGWRDIRIFPNGLDLETYQPMNRLQARAWLGLNPDVKLILFSGINPASNPYKGFQYLPGILDHLVSIGWHDRVQLVILGEIPNQEFDSIPVPVHQFGNLSDDIAIALINAAADVFVAPSIQDNLPNTVMEAMACGTPTAAFRVGGIPEMIEHRENGWLADVGDIRDLAVGIDWLLSDESRYQRVSELARKRAVNTFDIRKNARRHLDLYQELVS